MLFKTKHDIPKFDSHSCFVGFNNKHESLHIEKGRIS